MRFILLSLATLFFLPLPAQLQLGKQKNLDHYYEFKDIYDSSLGITIYAKLNFLLSGDSVRNNQKGYAAQGWWEDYYKSGAVLHTGFYVDGQLHTYKNFYENGQVERDFHQVDYFHYEMILYWPNGKVHSDIIYFHDAEESTKEYHQDGTPDYIELYAKKCEYLIYRQSYFDDGKMEDDMELVDKKKKNYSYKDYYENGQVKDEGPMQYFSELDDYLKDGTWKVYDQSGKQVATQTWVKGQMTEEKKE